jgi:RNA 3'-terminal phosphate cyclase
VNRGQACSFTGVIWGNVTNSVPSLPAFLTEGFFGVESFGAKGIEHVLSQISDYVSRKRPNAFQFRKVGILLYAETSEGYRIASTVQFEEPNLKLGNFTDRVVYYRSKLVRNLQVELAHGGVVDEHLAHQSIVLMALATTSADNAHMGKKTFSQSCTISTSALMLHTVTAMRIVETFLADIKFWVQDRDESRRVVVCERVGKWS